MIAASGCVLGIDVGFSGRKKTTGMSALWWNETTVTWRCRVASSTVEDRASVLDDLTSEADHDVLALAVDGPLMPELAYRPTYRCPEALLTRGMFGKRGKPGACNAGGGPRLHREATTLAHFALERRTIARATHRARIHERAVVEAFPNLFLGVLCDESDYPAPRHQRRWTDALFPAVRPSLERMLSGLLPGRSVREPWPVRGHDAIAGFVCALSALCVAAGRYVAVGAHADGFIMLPPLDAWGSNPWAARELRANVARHGGGVVYRDDIVWMDGTRA